METAQAKPSIISVVMACLIAGCGGEPRREPLSFEIAKTERHDTPRELPKIAPEASTIPEKFHTKVRVWLWFSMKKNCVPCEKLKRRLLQECRDAKIVVGTYGKGGVAHVWLFDSVDHKRECEAWKVDAFPTLILVEDGKEVLRTNGQELTAKSMMESLVGYLFPWPYRHEHHPRHDWEFDNGLPESRIRRHRGSNTWTNC